MLELRTAVVICVIIMSIPLLAHYNILFNYQGSTQLINWMSVWAFVMVVVMAIMHRPHSVTMNFRDNKLDVNGEQDMKYLEINEVNLDKHNNPAGSDKLEVRSDQMSVELILKRTKNNDEFVNELRKRIENAVG